MTTLKDWGIIYIKNKDVILCSIVAVEDAPEGFVVKYKDKEAIFLVIDRLVPELIERLKQEERASNIITYYTKENFEFLVSRWKEFAQFQKLTVYLANPSSNQDMVWSIKPYVHDHICDSSSLVRGLKAIAESVPLVKKLHHYKSESLPSHFSPETKALNSSS